MKRFLNNKKGSSLIMVLGAMLILTAVGVLVITMSSANIRMSAKYNAWSEEYYDLDYAAQERLISFDSAVLVSAEQMARYYLQNNYFAYEENAKLPPGGGMAQTIRESFAALNPSDLQKLLHDEQVEAALLLAVDLTKLGEGEDPEEVYAAAQAAYDTAMEKLATNTFDLLYYLRVSQLMKLGGNVSGDWVMASNSPEPPAEGEPDTNTYIYTTCADENPLWFPASITSVEGTLNAIEIPRIGITAFEDGIDLPLPKQVKVSVTLKSPGYKLSEQTRYVPLKVNPLYTNAVSAGGGIEFTGSGNVRIEGDVLSANKGRSKGLEENDSSGVRTESGVDVTVYGNLYSAGDIHIRRNGGKIIVAEYPGGYDKSLKKALYNNEYYYGSDVTAGDEPYQENYAGTKAYIAFIYEDDKGGNAYCNNLAVEEGVTSGVLSVAGDVWTQDDIQNDGGAGSSISVGGSYIGMSSTADGGGNPNGSSAVINNGVLDGSEISIDGNYIIPGTAFYELRAAQSPHRLVYYQTAESGTARTLESFIAYFADSGTTYFGEDISDEPFMLYGSEMSDRNAKIAYFTNNFKKNSISSGISVKSGASYYSLGVTIDNKGNIIYDDNSVSYLANESAFAAVQPQMEDIFLSKTQYFGTAGRSVASLVNGSFGVPDVRDWGGFHYYGGSINNVSVGGGVSRGIIFANGDLHLSGGTFTGAVICTGNLTIESGVTIIHSAEAVKEVLGVTGSTTVIPESSGSRIARRFFSPTAPLTMGEDLATEQINTVSVNAGERMSTAVDRYTIDAWRESSLTAAPPKP
ncbi:MAG: DUF2572 family protein [Clostridiaceae bacterium]|nr:DUF2572 family protein [Eubacteriales bacterium]